MLKLILICLVIRLEWIMDNLLFKLLIYKHLSVHREA